MGTKIGAASAEWTCVSDISGGLLSLILSLPPLFTSDATYSEFADEDCSVYLPLGPSFQVYIYIHTYVQY